MLINIGLYIVLSVTVGLLAVAVGYTALKIFKRDFAKLLDTVPVLIATVGSLAAVTGVLLFKTDIDLKNRPYVYAETKIFSNSANTFVSKTYIKNCGNTPAYNVVFDPTLLVNGKEKPFPLPETKSFYLYPNAEQYHHFPIDFTSGDQVEYSVSIYYGDSAGKVYYYSGACRFEERGGGYYCWTTISSEGN